MFIDPASPNTPFWATDIETGEVLKFPSGHSKAGQPLFKRRFIPASLFDNPYLAESGDYEAMLLSLPEHQRKQLLEGNSTKVLPFLSGTEPYMSLSLIKFPLAGLSLELATTATEVTQALSGLLYHPVSSLLSTESYIVLRLQLLI
jgi:hypothetical protein